MENRILTERDKMIMECFEYEIENAAKLEARVLANHIANGALAYIIGEKLLVFKENGKTKKYVQLYFSEKHLNEFNDNEIRIISVEEAMKLALEDPENDGIVFNKRWSTSRKGIVVLFIHLERVLQFKETMRQRKQVEGTQRNVNDYKMMPVNYATQDYLIHHIGECDSQIELIEYLLGTYDQTLTYYDYQHIRHFIEKEDNKILDESDKDRLLNRIKERQRGFIVETRYWK